MIYCGANQKLQIYLGGAVTTTQLPWILTAITTADVIAARNGTSNDAVAVDVCNAADGLIRHLEIYNADTVNATVYVRYNDNATLRIIHQEVLSPGYTLIYDSEFGWAKTPTSAGATTNALLDGSYHNDTLVGTVLDGDTIIGNVTPKWSRLAISIPVANVRNVLGIDNAELRPSWKTALDATAPTTIAAGATAVAGTSLIFAHRDHTHGAPTTYPATAHNILDSAYHGDALTGSVTRGDVLYGNATPKIARLALGGVTGSALVRDATDTLWSASAALLAGAANVTTNIAPLQTAAEAWLGPSSTTGVYFKSNNVGIGTTGPSGKLDVRDGNVYLTDADVAHGMTTWAPTNAFAYLAPYSTTDGGLDLAGFSDTDATGLWLRGIMGSTNPTDTTPAMDLYAAKANGTTVQALADAETAFRFRNSGTALVTILGSGNVGIGTTGPSEKLAIYGATAPKILLESSQDGGTASLYTGGGNLSLSIKGARAAGGASSGTDLIIGGVNDRTSGRVLDVVSGASTYMSITTTGNVGVGTVGPDRLTHAEISNAATNAITYVQRLSHITSGTAAAGFGVGTEFELEDDTGTNRVTGYIESLYNSAATASWKSDMVLKVTDSAGTREGLRMRASGTAPMIGFLAAAPVAQQTGHAAPTDLATALTFCAAIRTALQNYGLITTV